MAYFPNAFQQTLIVSNTLVSSGKPETLSQFRGGFFDVRTWNAVPQAEASVTLHPKVVFAVGNPRNTDILGSNGGYKETLKSRVIDPNYVHRVWKVTGNAAQSQGVYVGYNGTAGTAPTFYCGQTYRLRITVTGSPALRLVDHTIYRTFDVKTACCPSTATTPQLVDPIQVMLAFAQRISEDPILSKFISAVAMNSGMAVNANTYVPQTNPAIIPTLLATLGLQTGYSDTRFSYFSFDPRDHYEMEPVVISSAQLVDESGDPCSLFKQLAFMEWQPPVSAQGSYDSILRELILTNEYHQEPFPWDVRKKELSEFASIGSSLGTSTLYNSLYILYSTPRNSNPSGTGDNDLCLLRLCSPASNPVEAWFTAYLNSAGTGVAVQDFS
jgi:hypothetical protein